MGHLYNLLIVDDSELVRDGLRRIFNEDDRFHIIGEAANGREALSAIEELKPDVVTMDISMPEMDGITALKHIMITCPTPVVVMSSLSNEGAHITFDALRYGAVDFIHKPNRLDESCFDDQAAEIRHRVEYAASVEVGLIHYIRSEASYRPDVAIHEQDTCRMIVAMGAAEGGYSSLLKIIPHINAHPSVACLVSLYVAPEHVGLFAEYLNNHSQLQVKTAEHNDVIRPGVCYLRSGSDYMSVHKQGEEFTIHISPAPFASRRGSIDMLLFSSADVFANNTIGVVLSGSGQDGTEGMEEISRVGGIAIIQDPKTCLSKGMAISASAIDRNGNFVDDFNIAAVINNAIKS